MPDKEKIIFNAGSLIKLTLILITELMLGVFLFFSYPGLSMLFLGEGGDSPLYSTGNSVAWALSPIFLSSLFNLINIYNAKNNRDLQKVKTFYLVEAILLSLYVPFIICMYNLTNGFRI
jgi:hypothetical protein